MSFEEYALLTATDIEMKLDEAEHPASSTSERLSHNDIFNSIRNKINNK